MKLIYSVFMFICVLLLFKVDYSVCGNVILTTDELENFINPEDLEVIKKYYERNGSVESDELMEKKTSTTQSPDVGCFGAGDSFVMQAVSKIFTFNLTPSLSKAINTHFYFSSRKIAYRVQVYPGRQFDLTPADFDPKRKTVLIVHGFMSYSGADWVKSMTQAYLDWEDVNVIAVDWSGGSNTFKYWRAVANTRTVGKDIVNFMQQLQNATGFNIKNCHFIGHSLGAQIASFASHELGRVGRITGLDPALPCFNTTSLDDRLDPTDADFVDVIHTNGKLYTVGFGFPYPAGHIDFYPNGGIRQPGCATGSIPFYKSIDEAICSHGRAYLLFTESLTNKYCTFKGTPWDLTVDGFKSSLEMNCGNSFFRRSVCSEMGIKARKDARGSFLVITTDKAPFCVQDPIFQPPPYNLIEDITNHLTSMLPKHATSTSGASTISFMFPLGKRGTAFQLLDITTIAPEITTTIGWFKRIVNYF